MTASTHSSQQPQRLSHAVGRPLPGTLCQEGSLAQLLIRAAEGTETGITFVEGEEQETFCSYAEILQRAGRRLGGLRRAGLCRGDVVMLCLRESEDFVVSFWAALLGGIVPVPMAYPTAFNTPNHALTKVHTVWEQLERPWLLTDAAFVEHLDEVRMVLGLEAFAAHALDELTESSAVEDYSPGHGDDLAFLQYSSGSTGKPKGVMLTHANLLANIEGMILHAEFKPGDCFLSWMPYHHDMGLIGFHLTPLALGVPQINLSPLRFVLKPVLWLEKIHQHRATYTGSPNFGYRHVMAKLKPAQLARWDLSCLKLIFNGAEPISAPVMRKFMATLAPCGLAPTAMYPVYGMAEACLGASFPPRGTLPLIHGVDRRALAREGRVQPLAEDHPQALAVADEGTPVPGMEIRIADEHDVVVSEGRVGHVQMRGVNVTAGYYRNPEANRAALRDGWLDTGDLGFMLDGRLCITGRAKDIIFVNGQNYFAHDIEHHAEAVAGVQPGKVAACGWHDAAAGAERTALFLVVKPPRGETLEGVLSRVLVHVNQTLGIPLDYLVTVKAVPKTTSGKIQRYRLLQEFQDGLYAAATYAASDLIAADVSMTVAEAPDERISSRHEELIRAVWADVLECPVAAVAVDRPFLALGGTSLKAVQVLSQLEAACGQELGHDLLIQCRTVREMAAFLAARRSDQAPASRSAPKARAGDIAIVAAACRFPGAADPDRYWENIEAGRSSVGELPLGRWGAGRPEGTTVRGGFLEDPYGFDAAFFNIPEDVATALDPQQRLFLEIAWETLERGGVAGRRSDGQRVGLFVGASHNHYLEHLIHDQSREELERFASFRTLPEDQRQALLSEWRERFGHCPARPDTVVDNLLNMIAARISHSLNLKGPSLALDSACSSALVAVHLACDSLRRGECEMALAGGISLAVTATPYRLFQQAGTLAADGRCKVFDAAADGFALGEGGGAVLLAPLHQAMAAGLPVLAVIKGSAVNNDGRSLGVMAPNPDGQRKVIEAAYREHGLDPADVQYVEAHGTGTAIGDPSEVRALTQAYAGVPAGHCAIGSAKANLGHLLAAAGIAGLIKVVMALQHRRLPPNVNLEQPNPLINFATTPFHTLDRARDWPAANKPRRAAVNAFGFGGTNCHLVVEEAPALPAAAAGEPALRLLCLSAATESALEQRCLRLGEHLRRHPNCRLEEVCRSEHLGRAHLPWRTSLMVESSGQLAQQLAEQRVAKQAGPAKLALLFTGQGAQYPAMAGRLYQALPAFRRRVDECAAEFDRYLERPLLGTLYDPDLKADHLARTELTQPALFTIDYALGRLLLDWGLKPACLLGHSVGELAAACLAGVMSLADAARVVAARGRLIQALPARGGMAAVFAPQEELEKLLRRYQGRLWFAAHNGPHQVLSGELDALRDLGQELTRAGHVVRPLRVSHAFHTPLLEPMLEEFGRVLDEVQFQQPSLPLLSNVSGDWMTGVPGRDYWQRHVLAPVSFEQGMRRAAERGVKVFVECGPDRVLVNLARSILGENARVLSTLDRRRDDLRCLLESVGELYCQGADLDWGRIEGPGRVIGLPSYPFEHRPFRLDPAPAAVPAATTTERQRAPAGWFRTWVWDSPELGPEAALDPGTVLLFDDCQGLGEALAQRFSSAINPLIRVLPGSGFAALGQGRYLIDPCSPADYRRLLEAVRANGVELAAVVHLWHCRDGEQEGRGPLHQAAHEVLFLGQALAGPRQGRLEQQLPLRLLLVTRHGQAVSATDTLPRPEQTMATALAQVVGQELPGVQAQVVDCDGSAPADLAALLYRELRSVQPELAVVALRGGERLVRRLRDSILADAPLTAAIPAAGETCLITGGAEGIGARVALELARRGINLILTGRSVLPPREQWVSLSDDSPTARRVALLRQIEALGVRVDYYSADVADRDAMTKVMTAAGTLHGVIHAAGVVDREALRIVHKTAASVDRVLAPKVQGTLLLDELTRQQPLKCFVLFSSISATSPDWSPSLGDYVAANAFLDTFAQLRARRRAPGRTLAVNWSLWDDCGMGTDPGLKMLVRSKGLLPLQPAVAVTALLDGLELSREPVLHIMDCLPAPLDDADARGIGLDVLPAAQTATGPRGHAGLVLELLARQLAREPEQLDDTANFVELGLDSLGAVELVQRLGEALGRTLYPTLLFEYQSPQALAEYLDSQDVSPPGPPVPVTEETTVRADSARPTPEGGAARDRELRATPTELPSVPPTAAVPERSTAAVHVDSPRPLEVREQDIAIIGMSCRVPGADTLDAYWELLKSGRCLVGEVPANRWSVADYHGSPDQSHTSYSRWGGFLDQPYDFDPQFFGISPREAAAMDPQQRLFLEIAWEALQQSGYGGARRSREVGVFVGCEQNCYGEHFVSGQHYEVLRRRLVASPGLQELSEAQRNELLGTLKEVLQPAQLLADAVAGNGLNEIAARVSHWLDLRGPSLIVNTACSSALVALHLACESLRRGETEMAIAGGVYLGLSTTPFVFLSRVTALSPTGVCAPFDRTANGLVLGEGAASLVLKPLARALADGDHVHAVIKGSAINNDGHSSGLTAPNPAGQADAIRKAYRAADVDPATVSYIECHGTGTALGDPVEVEGMTQALRSFTDRRGYCGIGSVKSAIGHMLAAAGIPSVIKVVLAMQHRYLPATVNYREPNPHIDFAASPFYVVDGAGREWRADGRDSDRRPLRAGVNAFGFGGTNCHVVLEQAPEVPVTQQTHPQLLCLSGRSEQSLGRIASDLRCHLESHPGVDPAAVCLTAHGGQRDLAHRTALLVRDREHLLDQLATLEPGQSAPGGQRWSGRVNPRRAAPVVLVLDDRSPLDKAAVHSLVRRFPLFAAALTEAEAIAGGEPVLTGQYALGRLLQALGIAPAAVFAEGRGMVAGACLAGRISLDQAATLLTGKPPSGTVADGIPLLTPQGWAEPDLEVAELGRWLADDNRFLVMPEPAHRDTAYLHLGADAGVHQRLGTEPRWVDLLDGDVVSALGRLYALGAAFDYRLLAGDGVRRTPLPTFPFERRTFVYTPAGEDEEAAAAPVPRPAPTAAEPLPPAPGLRRAHPTALKVAERRSSHAALMRELSTVNL